MHAGMISCHKYSGLRIILPNAKSQNCSFFYHSHLLNDGPVILIRDSVKCISKKRYCAHNYIHVCCKDIQSCVSQLAIHK